MIHLDFFHNFNLFLKEMLLHIILLLVDGLTKVFFAIVSSECCSYRTLPFSIAFSGQANHLVGFIWLISIFFIFIVINSHYLNLFKVPGLYWASSFIKRQKRFGPCPLVPTASAREMNSRLLMSGLRRHLLSLGSRWASWSRKV